MATKQGGDLVLKAVIVDQYHRVNTTSQDRVQKKLAPFSTVASRADSTQERCVLVTSVRENILVLKVTYW